MNAATSASDAWKVLLGIGQSTRAVGRLPRIEAAIPFTLVTGFLGSGKTSLLQNVITQASGQRIAVLMNDFGAVNIDARLIQRRLADTIELSNGCVCCDMSAGLTDALAAIAMRPQLPDAVILEASGIAEPTGILHIALSNPRLRLNGVVTMVDTAAFIDQMQNPLTAGIVAPQVTGADIVVLNKADLVDDLMMTGVSRQVRGLRSGARLISSVHGRLPPEVLIGLQHGEHRRAPPAPHPHHHSELESLTFTSPHELNERALCELAGDLPETIFRAKGFVRLAGRPETRHLLQVVGRRWALHPEGAWDPRSPESQIVLIGAPSAAEIDFVMSRLAACQIQG